MDLLDEIRQRSLDPATATDDGAGIRGFETLPPVDRSMIDAVEQQLGFAIPELLAEIYCQVANGGIGPGYGLFRVHEEPKVSDLVETYRYMSGNDPKDTAWEWPEQLLPLFSHGCGMYECVDCQDSSAPVILHNPDFLEGRSVPSTLAPMASSLDDRLRLWLRGENPIPAANQLLASRCRGE